MCSNSGLNSAAGWWLWSAVAPPRSGPTLSPLFRVLSASEGIGVEAVAAAAVVVAVGAAAAVVVAVGAAEREEEAEAEAKEAVVREYWYFK
jgi:hypothetical protein